MSGLGHIKNYFLAWGIIPSHIYWTSHQRAFSASSNFAAKPAGPHRENHAHADRSIHWPVIACVVLSPRRHMKFLTY